METSVLTTYLQRTLDLAAFGAGEVKSGPLLGWVVVKDELITDEGTSDAVFVSPEDSRTHVAWRNSTLFLSIDPFANTDTLSSFCADANVRAYYVATDPNSPLRSAALHLNRRYLTWLRKKRPYVILKWAETANGLIARSDHQPYWISNTLARQRVHQWRSQEAAIWVGKNTYLHDNPRLNVRHWQGHDPIRLVIDSDLQLSNQLHVFDQTQPTLCYNSIKNEHHQNLEFIRLPDHSLSWKDRVQAVFDDLYQRQIQSVFVEGGRVLLSFLLANEWWDEARVFQAPINFGEGIAAPPINQEYLCARQPIGDNTLTTYQHEQPNVGT